MKPDRFHAIMSAVKSGPLEGLTSGFSAQCELLYDHSEAFLMQHGFIMTDTLDFYQVNHEGWF